MNTKNTGKKYYLELAIKKAGSQNKLAKKLGITQPAVWNWLHRDANSPPAQYAVKIEKLFGISKEHLRPDIFYN